MENYLLRVIFGLGYLVILSMASADEPKYIQLPAFVNGNETLIFMDQEDLGSLLSNNTNDPPKKPVKVFSNPSMSYNQSNFSVLFLTCNSKRYVLHTPDSDYGLSGDGALPKCPSYPFYSLLLPFNQSSAEIQVSSNCTCCSCDANNSCPTTKLCEVKRKKSSLSPKVLIGTGIVGGLFFIFLAIPLSVYYGSRRRRRSSLQRISTGSGSVSSNEHAEGGTIFHNVVVFSYDELERATGNFCSENEIGDGGFGVVFYGKLRDGREVAVKRMYEHSCRRVEQFMNEIEILSKIRHKHLVSLFGCSSSSSTKLLLVYEYIPNGTVFDHLHGNRAKFGALTWPIRMNIAIETATALAYLHASDIIHRDVKTNNILLDNDFCVKVADFGLSRLFPVDKTHISTAPQGTPGYVDPEYHQCYKLTDRSDVYSFGVVLIELVSSLPAIDITRDRSEINLAYLALNKIQRREYDELIDHRLGYKKDDEVTRMTTSVADLAFRCVQQDSNMRPTMLDVLEELKQIRSNGNHAHDDTPPPSSPPDSAEGLLLTAIWPTSATSAKR